MAATMTIGRKSAMAAAAAPAGRGARAGTGGRAGGAPRAGGGGAAAAALVALAVTGWLSLRIAQTGFGAVYDGHLAPLDALEAVLDGYAEGVAAAAQKARDGRASFPESAARIEAAEATIRRSWARYTAALLPEDSGLVDEAEPLLSAADALAWRLVTALRAGDAATLETLAGGELHATVEPVLAALARLMRLQLDRAGQAKDRFDRQALVAGIVHGSAALLGLAALAFGAWTVFSGVVRPLRRIAGATAALAGGDGTVTVEGTERADEIGALARAVRAVRDNMARTEALEAERARERAAREARAQKVEALMRTFDDTVAAIAGAVSSAADELQATAASMTAIAEETSRQATAAAAASEQASCNVQMVASAAEELSSAAGEIGRQVTRSSAIASQAVAEAERTDALVKGLAAAARKIGAVTALISEIANQTNLLALNATIEAARAGEAGKGFAVVAGEVKSLATQTARATEEISAQIAAMQSATDDTVGAIQSIGATIGRINEIATAIASAVEQQGAATQEIARNVHQAARGTQEVSGNIAGVTQAAGETGAAASQVLSAAGDLSRQAEALHRQVDGFLAALRAA
ncbi:MAG: HAMP domain-containing protein [Rhodospirillaceae bacterium]|nr:HAMP domain-containing protein [Rhodospirillaceae bacterium]